MVEKMSGDNAGSRASNALIRRAQSIKDWWNSDTAREKPVRVPKQFTIKFEKGTVFLSAVSSGDLQETENLLDEGVDIDYTNVDGLTALHQACIDEHEEMVDLLLDRHANIEARDNEGWTPLHAAASAGNIEIAKILINRGADLAAVNNEGEVPLDLAEEEDMEDFLSEIIDERNMEIEDARNEEERIMIEDANSWLNQNKVDEVLDWQGATSLHVAAAKGYNKVISLLLQIGSIDVNIRDNDGWTPIHAAVHWGSKTACELLTEAGANFDLKNANGDTPCDLAEPEFVKTAENCRKRAKELAKKPNFIKNKRIDMTIDVNENKLFAKEEAAISNLKKPPPVPIVKGSRAARTTKNGEKTNDIKVKNNKAESGSGESDQDADAGKRPVATANVTTSATSRRLNSSAESESVSSRINTSKPRPTFTNSRDDKKDIKADDSLVSKFSRLNKEPEKEEPKKEEPVTRTSRLNQTSNRLPSTKVEEKKPEENRFGRLGSTRLGSTSSNKDEKEDRQSRLGNSYSWKKDNSNADAPSTSVFGAHRTGGSDWRSKLAERSKDAENDAAFVRGNTKENKSKSEISLEESSGDISRENDSQNTERISSPSRRIVPRNLRETRRSTGVVYLPDDLKDEDENDSSESESKRSAITNDDDSNSSRTSLAERLRKKNQDFISSSDRTTERTSISDRSSTSDRYSSSTRGDGVGVGVGRTSGRLSSTTSSDTGDTKDLQRKLDQALKEVQDYKSKYDKMKQERDEIQKQLDQYKEDVEKMQELKNDNLRLKDENGALIRVISKLSRTPAS